MEIIDLTYAIQEDMITFDAPWHTKVSITETGKHEDVGRHTQKISLGTHSGTHIDAPLHFIKNGMSVDEIPLQLLIGSVRIVDCSNFSKNQAITKEFLLKVPLSKRMIFYFGWGKYWNTKDYYLDYPFFTHESVYHLIYSGVELIGMDTPSPDDSRIMLNGKILKSDQDSPIHKLFLSNGIILLEYLANLENVPDLNDWSIIALPLKLTGGDGSPARVCLIRRR